MLLTAFNNKLLLFISKLDLGLVFIHNPNMFMERTMLRDYLIPLSRDGMRHSLKVYYSETNFMPRTETSPKGHKPCKEEFDYDYECFYKILENSESINCTSPW